MWLRGPCSVPGQLAARGVGRGACTRVVTSLQSGARRSPRARRTAPHPGAGTRTRVPRTQDRSRVSTRVVSPLAASTPGTLHRPHSGQRPAEPLGPGCRAQTLEGKDKGPRAAGPAWRSLGRPHVARPRDQHLQARDPAREGHARPRGDVGANAHGGTTQDRQRTPPRHPPTDFGLGAPYRARGAVPPQGTVLTRGPTRRAAPTSLGAAKMAGIRARRARP